MIDILLWSTYYIVIAYVVYIVARLVWEHFR